MSEKTKLTDREMQVIAAAFNCMDAKPKINLPKLAGRTNYASTASANNAWSAIQKKLRIIDEELRAAEESHEFPSPAKTAPKSKSKLKSGTQAPANTPAGSPVPTGTGKKRGRPAAAAATEVKAESDDADATESENDGIVKKKAKETAGVEKRTGKGVAGKGKKGVVTGAEEDATAPTAATASGDAVTADSKQRGRGAQAMNGVESEAKEEE